MNESSGESVSAPEVDAPLRIFLSYRRTDDINFIGRFHDRLLDEFGADNVFRDLDSLHGGSNFPRVIKDEILRMDAVVAMIGPNWATRLREPGDFVTLEITAALERGCPVVPILIEDTPVPFGDNLPNQLYGLADLNAVSVRKDPDFRRDATRAIAGLRREAAAFRTRQEEENRHRAAALAEAQRIEAERVERVAELTRVREALEAELRRLENEAHAKRLSDEGLRLAEIVAEEQRAIAEVAAARRRVDAVREAPLETEGGAGRRSASPGSSTPRASEPVPVESEPRSREPTGSDAVVARSPAERARRGRRWMLAGIAVVGLSLAVVAALLARSGESTSSDPPGAATPDCRPLDGFTPLFCDDFEGASLDREKWSEEKNGGTVDVQDGQVTLSSEAAAFPFIVTNENPFPDSGSYRMEVEFQYNEIGTFGTGVRSQRIRPKNRLTDGDALQEFTVSVWQDGDSLRMGICEGELETGTLDTDPHTVRFEHEVDGTQSIYLDNEMLERCPGTTVPRVLWFGNPKDLGDDCEGCRWSEFTIQYIRVDVPT